MRKWFEREGKRREERDGREVREKERDNGRNGRGKGKQSKTKREIKREIDR